jgi:hypothetical protein
MYPAKCLVGFLDSLNERSALRKTLPTKENTNVDIHPGSERDSNPKLSTSKTKRPAGAINFHWYKNHILNVSYGSRYVILCPSVSVLCPVFTKSEQERYEYEASAD